MKRAERSMEKNRRGWPLWGSRTEGSRGTGTFLGQWLRWGQQRKPAVTFQSEQSDHIFWWRGGGEGQEDRSWGGEAGYKWKEGQDDREWRLGGLESLKWGADEKLKQWEVGWSDSWQEGSGRLTIWTCFKIWWSRKWTVRELEDENIWLSLTKDG